MSADRWFDGGDVERCGLNGPTVTRIDAAPNALSALRTFAAQGGQGWCSYVDEVIRIRAESDFRDGRVLHAQLADAERSIEVRFVGDGYRAVEIARVVGDDFFVQRHVLQGIEPGDNPGSRTTATYEIFWPTQLRGELEDAWSSPIVPHSRFVGLSGGES